MGILFLDINSNFITLIPKSPEAIPVDQCCLIALGNFIFKIITRILTNQLTSICSHIISPNQYGFIPDSHIGNYIARAFECFNIFFNTNYRGQMVLKVDIHKTFNFISWPFLLEVLRCFGFSSSLINWVSLIFKPTRISILIDGSLKGFFWSRGVH